MATILVLGVAWFTVGALGRAPVATAEREIMGGRSLQEAKQALLAYAAQYAARSDTTEPGQMPCPESVASIGGANEGQASTSCSNASATVGRLPWKTLGIDQLRDGDGEPLWYVLSPGFRSAPINFASVGQLAYNGAANAAVALVIAPGRALNTLSAGSPPAGCSNVNQQVSNRNAASLNVANFLECGNASGSYANLGTSAWTNDRVLSITAAEWADAIAPALNDRLQRQVATVLGDWHQVEFAATGKSWAATHGISYLPFASTWSTSGNPTTNNFCGNDGIYEGLAPVSLTCSNNPWTGSTSSLIGLSSTGCTNMGTYLRCTFTVSDTLVAPAARITASAVDVGRTYRSTINNSDITVTNSGSATISGIAISGSNSNATATIDVSWPLPLFPLGLLVSVDIPHLQQAAVLTDTRLTWFRNNNWHHYTYYAIAPGAAPPGTSACTPGTSCLTVTGLPDSTGNANDKRLALVLSGRALATQTHPSGSRADYFESDNASANDESFLSATISTTFNDRLAVCPFKNVNHAGVDVVVCN